MRAIFFKQNRALLTSGRLYVFSAHTKIQSVADMPIPFVQESNFWWLTNISSPGWQLIIDGVAGKEYLVAPEINDAHQLFDGSLSFVAARKASGVKAILTRSEGEVLLGQLSKKYETVYTLGKDPRAKDYDFILNPGPTGNYRKLKRQFQAVVDCRFELANLRAIKRADELVAIRAAIALTVEAFERVKATVQKQSSEYGVEAEFTHHFRSHNAVHAYEPIVAGGKNACTLHYIQNQDRLNKNELLLLDVGARVDGYAADITRTYQLGKATKRQQQVHAAVESAHKEIISLLKPGLSVIKYQEKVDEIMKLRLTNLGLLKRPEDYRRYFPHAISHGLGVDVHDALGRPSEFKEGMVLTVEPGIYISEEGIGVRIEDDILITKTGHENLSAALPTSL